MFKYVIGLNFCILCSLWSLFFFKCSKRS